jgi:hypothetical protein
MTRIYITEEQAKRLFEIKEDNSEKEIINEMALSLKDYSNKLFNLRNQIIENWCLCRYCKLYDSENFNYNHWLIELRTSIQNIKFLKIKNNIDKRKVVVKELIRNCDLDDSNVIYLTIQDKFDDEHINDDKIRLQIAEDFSNNIQSLIRVLSDDTYSFNSYKKDMFDVE